MVERIRCEWTQPPDEPASGDQDEFQRHADHGNHMDRCDASVCVCGNKPHLMGFYPCDSEGNAVDPQRLRPPRLLRSVPTYDRLDDRNRCRLSPFWGARPRLAPELTYSGGSS